MATKRQEQFYNEVYAGARQAGLSDARARLAAAQASLETGYGKSMPGGNMFGIKAGKSWTGPTQNVNTWEDIGGRVNIVDKFRSYENPFDSLSDWVSLTDRRFPAASAATSFSEAVDGLRAGQRGGYATDRNYDNKLTSIDKRFGEAAQQNYGLMGREIPIPSVAPRGVMEALGSTRQEIADFRDGGLRNASFTQAPSFPATPMPVERGLLADVGQPVDQGRFGPTTPNISYSDLVATERARRDVPANTAQYDSGRFSTATSNIPVSELAGGLLAQKAELAQPQGILNTAAAAQPALQAATRTDRLPASGPASFQGPVAPGMQPAMDAANLALDVADQRAKMGLPPINQPAVQPAYVAPMVTTGAAPAAASPARPAMGSGILSADGPPTGGFGPSMTVEDADRMKRNLQMRTLGGGVLGGLLGGVALGPVGALIGGYAGRQMGARTYYPEAPKPSPAQENKGYREQDLSREGRDIQKQSKQFEKAVSSGKGGLW